MECAATMRLDWPSQGCPKGIVAEPDWPGHHRENVAEPRKGGRSSLTLPSTISGLCATI